MLIHDSECSLLKREWRKACYQNSHISKLRDAESYLLSTIVPRVPHDAGVLRRSSGVPGVLAVECVPVRLLQRHADLLAHRPDLRPALPLAVGGAAGPVVAGGPPAQLS